MALYSIVLALSTVDGSSFLLARVFEEKSGRYVSRTGILFVIIYSCYYIFILVERYRH